MLVTFFTKQTRHNHRFLKPVKSLKHFSKNNKPLEGQDSSLWRCSNPRLIQCSLFPSSSAPLVGFCFYFWWEGPMCESCTPHAKASIGHWVPYSSVLLPSDKFCHWTGRSACHLSCLASKLWGIHLSSPPMLESQAHAVMSIFLHELGIGAQALVFSEPNTLDPLTHFSSLP